MTIFPLIAVFVTSATVVVYGQAIWDPVALTGKFGNAAVVAFAVFALAVATLSVNVAANIVSPSYDFSNAWPKLISFRTGGLITGVIGILIQPWNLLSDPHVYIFTWLGFYGGATGAIAGVLIADYWLVRKKNLALGDLYRTQGVYTYNGGWNWLAVAATLDGCALAWIGLVVPLLRPLYSYAWFVGFGTAALSYLWFWKVGPRRWWK